MTTSTIKRRRSPSAHSPPHDDSTTDTVAATPVAGAAIIAKNDSEESESLDWTENNYINPFIHRLNIENRADLAKIYILTALLVPLRVVGCVLSLVSAWMFACIGLYGTTVEEINKRPLSGWRRNIQTLVASAMRMLYAAGSFHYVTFKGQRASPKEAPILVVAPHSSYVDSIVVVTTGPPAIVAKRETADIPLLGKIINYAQPIYVQREDPNSRQNTIREIVERARSGEDWPQVVIFAEGTCTNRKALIKFKGGAFYPGVPVQPVLLRYPNKYDTFTWTWDGPGVLKLLWLTMASFYSRCEIEFLPVYHPSEEEKANPNLYAKNVREVMAKALGVPTSEYSFEDVIVMTRARDLKIPLSGDIVEIERCLDKLNLISATPISELTTKFSSIPNRDKLDFLTFSELLEVNIKNPHLHRLFSVLDYRHAGTVSLKNLLLCAHFCKMSNAETIEYLKAITNIYTEERDQITRPELAKILKHANLSKFTTEKIDALYVSIDVTNRGKITFDEFERYVRDKSEFKSLFKKHDHVRRKLASK
ncbi:lysophosphatidylcholine acyltransferase-like [Musca vetustissima]|uniref:lysophosphatidylcholine acyltransferase-like n=1 Tax=Musca vetustissima TaxID=27455 RepID=UPI002AB5EA53|nr:lysophosphatidylcholine acyltransferase-like [Musca vetustissima]